MTADLRPYRPARWGRLLVLSLAGTLLLQSGGVRVLVQHVGQARAHQTCRHCANGFCPRNPDGPCPCMHSGHTPSEPDGAVVRSCGRTIPDALAPLSLPKWQSSGAVVRPGPRRSRHEYHHFYQALSPQRVGDDIFRPPRATPPVRLS